ncbi:MAG TPA: arylesterase [Gammaproteobacteria bacterium]|jgi:acyl-CoA thioesterase-1|nr:arylesterase [Gammaproteobacteria bacterium]MDP7153786.1 arylesterase [Gammaproteobacteria bacterium]MDP7661085.1 arylesterase [Gammaproteobacteria bacterium]HJP37624.1 arylesterase [Gammaproteobacteria bacterium]
MFFSKRSFISILLTLLLVGVACRADSGNSKILIIGDSLSAGFGLVKDESWTTLLQNRLSAKGYVYQVVNASISGDTTGGGLRRLPRALQVNAPAIVIIELGGNDGLRGTPISVIRKNLATMIELSQAADARVILAGMAMPPNYGQAYTDGFAGIYAELAEQYGAALIKFFMKNVALTPALMQADQIHPNAKGQPYLLDNVWATLENML